MVQTSTITQEDFTTPTFFSGSLPTKPGCYEQQSLFNVEANDTTDVAEPYTDDISPWGNYRDA